MSQSGPVWGQWVVDRSGNTVWSHEPPPKSHYDAMDPVLLPDANTWEQPVVRLLLFTRLRKLPLDIMAFPERIDYDELTFIKARTSGDARVWVETNRFAEIQRKWYKPGPEEERQQG